MDDNKKIVKKRKLKKIKLGYVLAFLAILVVAIVVIKLILPSGSSKYGNRLDGIKKIKFGKEEKNKVIEKVKSDDRVTSVTVDVKGKIINVIYNVNKDTSIDDAKNIANNSLGEFTDEVKNFYDIQYMASKKDEEGTKTTITKDDGTTEEVTVTTFPIMGYKKNSSSGLVWSNNR